MQRLRPLAAIAAGALALWLVLPSYVNYDTAWSLVWGRGLADGVKPQLEALAAPTPHPLGTALGVLLAPLGGAAGDAVTLLVLGSLTAVLWLAFALGRAWFDDAAGWVAAALALTSVPLLTAAARSYLDVPYLALLLGALLVETRRRRAGAPVLALLAAAGMWRPEAWVFAAAYWAWAARGRPRSEAVRLGALAAAAPAVWLLGDMALAGDPLHSLTWTREQAAALGRARGPDALAQALPDKLAQGTGLPVLAAGTAGLALLLRRRPAARPAATRGVGVVAAVALGASLATAAALTAAGMPVVERYLLAPLLLLMVLSGGAAVQGWRSFAVLLSGDSTSASARYQRLTDTPLLAAGTAGLGVLAVLACTVPGRLGAVAREREALAAQAALRADLRALADRDALPARCARIAVANHKLVPLLALWTGRAPTRFASGQASTADAAAEAYIEPATAAARRTLLLASSDPPEAAPQRPAGAAEIARSGAWRIEARC